jgi:hypothetical protein
VGVSLPDGYVRQLNCDANTQACRATRHCTCMLRMQGDTAVAARRHSRPSLPNAAQPTLCPSSQLVQLTCTGRGKSVQHCTAVYQPCSSPGLCMAAVISRLGKASTVSTVKGLRPKARASCLFHKHVGPVALVPLLLLGAMLVHGVLRRKAARQRETQRFTNQGVLQ